MGRRLGQHFLRDLKVVKTIVAAAELSNTDETLEIGPGRGVLTGEILGRGGALTAIELDKNLARELEARFLGCQRFRMIQGDFLKADLNTLYDPKQYPIKVLGNLPYSITSLALRKALWAPKPPSSVTVLVQREVAERAVSLSRHCEESATKQSLKQRGSLLSLMVALAADSSRIVTRVARGAFFPPPKVESAVLQVIPMPTRERLERWGIDPERIMEIAKRGFAHPRKLLTSNLGIKKFPVEGIAEKARAEVLSPEDWA